MEVIILIIIFVFFFFFDLIAHTIFPDGGDTVVSKKLETIGSFLWKYLIKTIQFVYIVGALVWWDENMFEKGDLRMIFALLFKISLFVVPYMLYEKIQRAENRRI